jgi:hypothetical protein
MEEQMSLYDKAISAVMDLFDDRSVTVEKTIENLQSLQLEIDVYIEALEADLG